MDNQVENMFCGKCGQLCGRYTNSLYNCYKNNAKEPRGTLIVEWSFAMSKRNWRDSMILRNNWKQVVTTPNNTSKYVYD